VEFEWSRSEFTSWSASVGLSYGYAVELRAVGDVDPEVGSPTQLAVFTREGS